MLYLLGLISAHLPEFWGLRISWQGGMQRERPVSYQRNLWVTSKHLFPGKEAPGSSTSSFPLTSNQGQEVTPLEQTVKTWYQGQEKGIGRAVDGLVPFPPNSLWFLSSRATLLLGEQEESPKWASISGYLVLFLSRSDLPINIEWKRLKAYLATFVMNYIWVRFLEFTNLGQKMRSMGERWKKKMSQDNVPKENEYWLEKEFLEL